MVAVARSSPIKLRRNSKASGRSDSHGGPEGNSSDCMDTGTSDYGDSEMISDSGSDMAAAEASLGRPQAAVGPQKGERAARNTSDRSSLGPRGAEDASAKQGVRNVKPVKRPFPKDGATSEQPRSALRTRSSDAPPAKVRRADTEPPAPVAGSSTAGSSHASSSVSSSGTASDSDSVMIEDDCRGAAPGPAPARRGISGVPADAASTSAVQTDPTAPQKPVVKAEWTTPEERVASDTQMRQLSMARAAMRGYPCPICDKKHQTLTQTTLHYYTHDVGASLFRCKICNAKFTYWRPAHIREKHPHIRPDEVFANMENNFGEGKRDVARLMLRKKKLDSEDLLDLVLKKTFSLNSFRVKTPPPKQAPPISSTLERLASARAKEKEEKKTEEGKRQNLAALKQLRIAKPATSDIKPALGVKPSSSGVKSSTSNVKSSASDIKSVASKTKPSVTSSSAGAKDLKTSPKDVKTQQAIVVSTTTSKPVSAPVPPATPAPTLGSNRSSCHDTSMCRHCNFRGIPAAVTRHEYWHTQEAKERRDTLRHRCHLCYYASAVAAHVQVHLMCAHFIERPAWDGNGGKPGTLPGGRGRVGSDNTAGSRSDKLPDEQKRCLDQKRYDCPLCDYFFSDKSEFGAHVEQFHVKGEPERRCPAKHCYAESTSDHSKWYHKSGPLRNRLCSDCGGTIYHGKDKQHSGRACVRDRALTFECPMPICGFGTKKQDEIDRHLVECHSLWVRGLSGARKSPYFCPECPAEVAFEDFLEHVAEHRKKREAKGVKKNEKVSEKKSRASGEKLDRVPEKPERVAEKETKRTEQTTERRAVLTQKKPVPEKGNAHSAEKKSAEKHGTRSSERGVNRAAKVSPQDRATRQSTERTSSSRPAGRSVRQPADPAPPKPADTAATAEGGDREGRASASTAAAGQTSDNEVIVIDDDSQGGDEGDVPTGCDSAAGDRPGKGTCKSATNTSTATGTATTTTATSIAIATATTTAATVTATTATATAAACEAKNTGQPAATAVPPRDEAPSQRWSRVSVGDFLTSSCQQPIQESVFFTQSGGHTQTLGGVEQCFFCDFSAESTEEVETHLSAKHTQQVQSFETFLKGCVARNRRRKCPICGIGFRAKWVFFRHIMSHRINVPMVPQH